MQTAIRSSERPRMRFTRQMGQARGDREGPTLIVVGGIHGNEPAGLIGARRVLDRLERDNRGLRGELIVFSGNRAALELGRRYQVKDLNRQWSDAQIVALRRKTDLDAEDREQRELLSAIEDTMGRARGDVYFMDLHTTSAAGIPFVLFGDTLRQRRFAFSLPLPVIIGLEEQVDGVLS